MFAEFALWWVSQMRALAKPLLPGTVALPDAFIAAIDAAPGQDIDVAAQELTGTLLLRRDGQETALQRLGPADPPPQTLSPPGLATGLRLPRDCVLSHELVLPLAAARDLRSTIGYEMDRLTPFAADELIWRTSGVRTDRARGKLTLTLTIVLRAQVEALRTALAHYGIIPSFIETATGRIELDGATRRGRRGLWLPALCAGLAVACLATPFVRQQIALARAADAIDAAMPAARTAQGLRQQLAAAAAGRDAIAQARHNGDALQVLATLTAALPDNSWLSDLNLKSGTLTFDGQSTDAAKLIGLLSAVPELRDPSFTAPVTRSNDGKADLFSMRATVAE